MATDRTVQSIESHIADAVSPEKVEIRDNRSTCEDFHGISEFRYVEEQSVKLKCVLLNRFNLHQRGMIRPLIHESEWRRKLDRLPTWVPPRIPTVIISPHPDDETLSIGALIHRLEAKDVEVSVIAVTDGENAYEGEYGLGQVREREQVGALAKLGVPANRITRLRLPDSGLLANEDELYDQLLQFIRPGTHVVAPWPHDFHPDHEVCGRVAQKVANECGAQLTFYFFWTWHRGTPDLIENLKLALLPVEAREMTAKQAALRCHQSQLRHSSGDPILPENLLAPAQWPFEVYLPA